MTTYAYPLCHGVQTVLRGFGWYCAGCGEYLPFRDDEGRTYAEQQEEKRQEKKKQKRRKQQGRVI